MSLEFLRQSLPAALAESVKDYRWSEILGGCSAARVFRLETNDEKSLYLKIADSLPEGSLLPERLKLEWLKNRLPVPEVIEFVQDKGLDYLLISEISGIDASGDFYQNSKAEIVEELAKGLKMIHGLPVAECPFDARLDYKIKCAELKMLQGLVDESDFDHQRAGRTAEDLFGELTEKKPFTEDLVFTHGDFCLPNIIFENRRLSGFIDWGNAGVADKYQDIALLARSVEANFGSEYTQKLFTFLDIEPDWQKINFYTLLDEFF